jgi:hypothetical protein
MRWWRERCEKDEEEKGKDSKEEGVRKIRSWFGLEERRGLAPSPRGFDPARVTLAARIWQSRFESDCWILKR